MFSDETHNSQIFLSPDPTLLCNVPFFLVFKFKFIKKLKKKSKNLSINMLFIFLTLYTIYPSSSLSTLSIHLHFVLVKKMSSSAEPGTAWSTAEDVLLCQCWVSVCHHPIAGSEMRLPLMWKKIHGEFQERSGSPRTEQGLQSRWRFLNKELSKWRDAKKKAQDNYQSGTSLGDEVRK